MRLDVSKLDNLILYIAGHPAVSDLGMTKLYKLIYFSDTKALRDSGKSITGSEYIKYPHGPVPSRADREIKKLRRENRISTEKVDFLGYTMNKVSPKESVDIKVFSPEEKNTIDEVCERFGRITAKTLSNASHSEPAWAYAPEREKLSEELMLYGDKEDPDGL